jgi:hypothetical protein
MDPKIGEISLITEDSTTVMAGTLTVVGNGCTVSSDMTISSATGHSSRLLTLSPPSSANAFHFNLENFTISNFGNSSIEGGGLFLTNIGSSTLRNMIFQNNAGDNGGAVFLDMSVDVLFQSCSFVENNASTYGAGVFIYTNSLRISFVNCSFLSNIVAEDGGVYSRVCSGKLCSVMVLSNNLNDAECL